MKKKLSPFILVVLAALTYFQGCQFEKGGHKKLAAGDTIFIAILSTTDLHGYVRAWDYYLDQPDPRFSMAKAATAIDSIRKFYPHNLLLDAGDWLQGNPFAEYSARVENERRQYGLLKAADFMRYDAFVIGNHEFNYGLPYLNKKIGMAKTPIIAANVYHHGTKDPAFTPYIMKNVGGVSVAIIGLTTPGSAVWDGPRVEGILDFGDGPEAADRFVKEVREKGAELVVILAHSAFEGATSYTRPDLGAENYGKKILDSVDGINALVMGHRHRVVEKMYRSPVNGREIPVIESGLWASHVGGIYFSLTKNSAGKLEILNARTEMIETIGFDEHPKFVKVVERQHQKVREYVAAPVGSSPDLWETMQARIKDTPIIDLIQMVQIKETGAQLSAAAAFTTGLAFGNGDISLGELALLYPYENTLYKIRITGKQLRDYLEFSSQYFQTSRDGQLQFSPTVPGYNFDIISGVDYVIDIRKEPGSRIVKLEFQGRPVQGSDSFTLALNSYRAAGGGNYDMIKNAEVLKIIDRPIRNLIVDYMREKGEIRHDDVFRKNWELVY